jgi:hypothetical protein
MSRKAAMAQSYRKENILLSPLMFGFQPKADQPLAGKTVNT